MHFERLNAIRRSFPVVTAGVCLSSVVATILYLEAGIIDCFQRGRVGLTSWQGLWSGHCVHFSYEHLFWDLIGTGFFGVWLERLKGSRFCFWLTLVSAPVLIGGVLWLHPELSGYGGLSGLACVYAGAVCAAQIVSAGKQRLLGIVLLMMLTLKLATELTAANHSIFVSTWNASVVPVASAHGVGLLLGALGAIFNSSRYRRRAPWRANLAQIHIGNVDATSSYKASHSDPRPMGSKGAAV